MSLYVDASALLKRYVEEAESAAVDAVLRAEPELLTGRHTIVEVRRNLARLLDGASLRDARTAFMEDMRSIGVIELDETTCDAAAAIAEATGARTLDALHLAAAQRVSAPGVAFLTFDLRQAQVARAIGLEVAGA